MADTYHHGNLAEELLARVAEVVARDGVAAVTLRGLAADLGVSHTAPRHHFGSRRGVLTAFAAQGFGLLAESLEAVTAEGGSFLDVGVGYVAFAQQHPAHFQVMFDTAVLDEDDPALVAARDRSLSRLRAGAGSVVGGEDDRLGTAMLAGWAMMHGLACLDASRALDRPGMAELTGGDDVPAVARRVGALLYGRAGPR